jgi:hypothetical protein
MRVTSLISWDMETGAVLSHVYTEGYEGPVERCDRSIAKAAGNQAGTNEGNAGQYGAGAAQIGSSIIPGLEAEARGGQGLTPRQKNDALVAGSQAIGGVNSGITGDANLAAARTRNAGGFTGALDEAARIKGRQQSTNALGVSAEDTALANEKQLAAQKELGGLYGTDTSAQLASMGLANQDLATQLKANQQGWLQNTEGGLDTLANVAGAAAKFK